MIHYQLNPDMFFSMQVNAVMQQKVRFPLKSLKLFKQCVSDSWAEAIDDNRTDMTGEQAEELAKRFCENFNKDFYVLLRIDYGTHFKVTLHEPSYQTGTWLVAAPVMVESEVIRQVTKVVESTTESGVYRNILLDACERYDLVKLGTEAVINLCGAKDMK